MSRYKYPLVILVLIALNGVGFLYTFFSGGDVWNGTASSIEKGFLSFFFLSVLAIPVLIVATIVSIFRRR